MEKMKANTKNNLQLFLIMFVIYLAINGMASWFYYQNYFDSIDVIAQMISEDGRSQIDVAADILKDLKVESATQGKQILESYGYISNGENALYGYAGIEETYENCI